MWTRNTLLAGIALAALMGCARGDDQTSSERVLSSLEHEPAEATTLAEQFSSEPIAPSTGEPGSPSMITGWPQTSAANPTGWADAAERRCEEGLACPAPSAVGGGPSDSR